MRAKAVVQYLNAPIMPAPFSIVSDFALLLQAALFKLLRFIGNRNNSGETREWMAAAVNRDHHQRVSRSTLKAMRKSVSDGTPYRSPDIPYRDDLLAGSTEYTETVHNLLEQWQLASDEEHGQASSAELSKVIDAVKLLQEKVHYFSEEKAA